MNDTEVGISRPKPRRGRFWALAAIVLAAVASVWFWRRQLTSMLADLRPYTGRRAEVSNPTLIINRWSGDGKAEAVGLVDHARSLGIRTVLLEKGDDLTQLAYDAIEEGADAIGMAGGDGSLGLVAAVAAERDIPFFCVPVGTRNHFALDLGLDRDDPLAALVAVHHGDEVLIDYGLVGGRVFLNNVSLGVYAAAVHKDAYRGEKAKTLAEVMTEAAEDPSKVEGLDFEAPGGRRFRRVPMVLISTNPYTFAGPPDFGRRPRMDAGTLGVVALTSLPDSKSVTRVTISDLAGWHEWATDSIRIESDGSEILTGVDGEALTFESPLDVTVEKQGLRVLVPQGVQPGYLKPPEALAARLLDVAATAAPRSTLD